jgi:SsrA-binding protein
MRVVNRQAYFDYEVLEKYEAGLVLTGAEVKSAKSGNMSLAGARAVFIMSDDGKNDELWMIGAQINPYLFSRSDNYDPLRSRKLLLTKAELVRIKTKLGTKGLTMVPLSCYNKSDLIKVELGLVRGKKRFEKREELRKRDTQREIEQKLKTLQRR